MKKRAISAIDIVFSSLIIIVLVYFFYIGINNIFRYNIYKVEYRNLLKTYTEELKQNQQFRQILADLNSDEFWELEARKRLGFVKEDEWVYRFYE